MVRDADHAVDRTDRDGPGPARYRHRDEMMRRWAGPGNSSPERCTTGRNIRGTTPTACAIRLSSEPVPTRANSPHTERDVKRGRMAAHMIWELKPDEALIVEMDNHDGFWIFGMGKVFVGSTDFLYRPVSYTPARTRVDGDGVVRLVIAHDDPGVHNWLDTQGFSNGNLTYRNLMSQNAARFRTRLVQRCGAARRACRPIP